jgi:hypothetical protein
MHGATIKITLTVVMKRTSRRQQMQKKILGLKNFQMQSNNYLICDNV